ncbi:hypothetical protein CW745_03865 [Psychromonas sp. psych-6C06]|uniref:hypothetical protein n=1 Tax=Psychromonas sp. psych-6C06 TaxID=2058089 RepID=UPI000C32E8F7|nr:hypothetical protein [Psychromonas sp. psych-6C06]PKF62568.1 hypothetical protein CW745_03865 [Psychromonas sp. psych-6C06]
MLTKSRVAQLLIMLMILLALFFWRTFETSFEANDGGLSSDSSEQISMLRCDYRSPCEFITEHGTYFLNIKNLPIESEQWIDFQLMTANENDNIVSAKIVGKTMFMGRIPVTFKQTEKQRFDAKSMVGACTTKHMIWSLEIAVENEKNVLNLSYDFMVSR